MLDGLMKNSMLAHVLRGTGPLKHGLGHKLLKGVVGEEELPQEELMRQQMQQHRGRAYR